MKTLLICAVLLALPWIALATPVPDTGQTKCYDNTQEIACPSPGDNFYGQDANYAPCNPHSYTKLDANSNPLLESATEGVMVRDNATSLIWQKDTAGIYTWQQAIDYCDNLVLGVYSDWRLPTVKELSILVDSSITSPGPTIDTNYYPYTRSLYYSYYWSSTTCAGYPNDARNVYFNNGYVDFSSKSNAYYVRAVHGRQCGPFDHYTDHGDGTVTDTDTGLMWQKDTALGRYTWEQALSYCETLSLAGYTDWRLPNRNELQSLLDYEVYPLSINTTFFPNTVASFYWSSTTYVNSPRGAWLVSFMGGFIGGRYNKLDADYVRAVRGGQCGSLGDLDGDGILDDGDNTGIIGDNPCTGGETTQCDDNCPNHSNPGQEDADSDKVGDAGDNCPNTPNPNQNDTDHDCAGDVCDNCPTTYNPDQQDSYPPGGNNWGDACDCEGNFNCSEDQDVDGSNAALFKADFGRSVMTEPCTGESPCNGDFNCDGDADGTDAALFKQDFGRSSIQNPCPACVAGVEWCAY